MSNKILDYIKIKKKASWFNVCVGCLPFHKFGIVRISKKECRVCGNTR